LQIILAYNSPEDLPVEQEIRELEQCYPNFQAVRVQGSTSKSDNVNGVMHKLKGEFVGIFDSDHVPMPGSFECAWRNLEQGFHYVQGRTRVNHRFADDWLGRGVAAEFEVSGTRYDSCTLWSHWRLT
jgi:cellulose synthase/poly-beta-1,6-N-acetylglucosamine synthase-like glycosyltransferase